MEFQDLPESCPVCGKDNSTDAGEWVCEGSPGFCTNAHEVLYLSEQRKLDEAAAGAYASEQDLIRGHNDKCPQCKGQTRKYCFHTSNLDNQDP